MFFNGIIQRKLTSLLRPWLTQEPQFEVKLGFLSSLIIAKNLNFDTRALSTLIDGGDALELLFNSFTIDEVIVRVAHWSAPAFTVEFNGVNVTLLIDKRNVKRVDKSVDDYLKEQKKKILDEIDSDGTTLHNKIENMMMAALLKSHFKDSLTNLVLMHCCLQLNEVRIRVEFPGSDDKLSWLCYSKELNAQSSNKDSGCFLGGFICLVFLPLREASFDLETSKLEIGAEKRNHNSCILSCVNPYLGINMKDFFLVKSALSVQEMNFSFSPTQLQMMGAFNNLLNIECNHVRSGRLLWGIARWKISHSFFLPRRVLYTVAHVAVFWLRLVKEYHYFLVLVGYSENEVKMPNDPSLSRLAEQHWKIISQTIEKELPAEAIASARRVARQRAALQELAPEDIVASHVSSDFNSFWRMIMTLAFIWWAAVRIINIIWTLFGRHKRTPKVSLHRMTSEVADQRCCFLLSLGKISAVISCIDAHVRTNSNLRKRTFHNDLYSFLVKVKRFLFVYEDGISEQYLSVTLGFLEVASVPMYDNSDYDSRPKFVDATSIRSSKDDVPDGLETILSGEPALLCRHFEEGETGPRVVSILEQLSREMEVIWEKMLLTFQESKCIYDGSPWAIFVIHTHRVYRGIENSDSGFSKYRLMVGKLHILLGYLAIVSIATLTEQVEHAFYRSIDSQSAVVPLHGLRTIEESQDITASVRIHSNIFHELMQTMKKSVLKLLPEKHVDVRAVVAGPYVKISLKNEKHLSSNLAPNATYDQNGIDLIIDVHNTDYAVWPTSKSGVAPCREYQRPDGFESELFNLEEPVVDGFSESVNIAYASKGQVAHFWYLGFGGLNVSIEDLVNNHSMQVLLLKPMTAKISSLRNYLYSYARSDIVSSLSLHVVTFGITGSLYMDELYVILKAVEGLFSAASTPAPGYSGLYTVQNNMLTSENKYVCTAPANEELLATVNEELALSSGTALCFLRASFEFSSFEISLHKSRNGIDRRCFPKLFDSYSIQRLGFAELPNRGIWLSIQKSCIDVTFEEAKAEANVNFRNFLVTMLGLKNQSGNDGPEVEDAVIHSVDRIHEVSLSTCTISLLIDCVNDSGALITERLNSHIKGEGTESNTSAQVPRQMLLINIAFVEVFLGTCPIKNGLSWTHPTDKLHFSLAVGREFQSVTTEIQGGRIFIEVKGLALLGQCCTSYLDFVKSLLTMNYPHKKSRTTVEGGLNVLGNVHIEGPAPTETAKSSVEEYLKSFSINVSQLSLVFLLTDESRVVKEYIGRVNLNLKLWSDDSKKYFSFNIHHMGIVSGILGEGTRNSEKDIRIPHFSSEGLVHDSLSLNNKDAATPFLHVEKTPVFSENATCSSSLASCSASSVNQSNGKFENCMLEKLAISISAEKYGLYTSARGWSGNGSVSGLNLVISLSDIQILLATMESLAGSLSNEAGNPVEERSSQLIDQQLEEELEEALPDGAVVAVQDVHQHLYITIESVGNKFKLGGTTHYSIAGRKALFRVKWHKRGLWNFSSSWFSLLSLHAKSDSGVPLRLNYVGSSGFVDITSTDDNACALWKIVSSKHENYEDDVDLDPLNRLGKNTFYLVNKKSNSGAAFNRGALEFVKKPGNPFKFKIFHGHMMDSDSRMTQTQDPEAHALSLIDSQDISEEAVMAPCIILNIENISLILVHELTDPKDNLPLLQGSVDRTDVIVQILPQKTRVMSTLNSILYYFDVHRFTWREFVLPIETSIYWRSTSSVPVTEKLNKIQSHLYFRIEEFDISVTELLLDILLYVVGKLDLAGPFAVKNSAVVANCCKVVNELDLDLLCYINNNQSARVGRRQSAFLLRHLMEAPEESFATVLLENPGISSTSSVHVPLSRTRIFAWRTRIISQQDSRTCPGPFIVFDIKKNAEEGLSLHVSPLLRLHNNTGFPVELRIQRPESVEAESASVLLKEGDTVDDCMAAFDAVSLSGGAKKALLSFGVGNFVLSFRPKIQEEDDSTQTCPVGWSENLKGGKAVCLSGVIDKLGYQVRKALSIDSWKHSFSTAGCSVGNGDTLLTQMHFLVHSIARDVPIMQPSDRRKNKNSSIALQEQKEIFLLPTVRVSNLLESDIHVLLSDTEISTSGGKKNINQATIQSGSTVDLYANPAVIFFNLTLTMFSCSCKPVNCSQYLKKLNKKDGIQFLDIDLEFCSGLYFACLRLVRGNRGMLEASVFTQYSLRNDTDFLLFCAAPHLKPLSRHEAESHTINTPPQFGTLLPPKLTRSWFMKSSKLRMMLLDEESPMSTLDLDALSGLAEIKFSKGQGSGKIYLVKLGISLRSLMNKTDMPARMVSVVPRFIICNDSDEQVFVRQCFLEGDFEESVRINSKQKAALFFRVGTSGKRDSTVFNKLLQKHKASEDDASFFLQFNPNETLWGWSGPVCVASLGCFFLKFKRYAVFPMQELDLGRREDDIAWEYAAVRVVEESSAFVLHFRRPPDTALPYRIENNLHNASITYYQKDTFQPETLESGGSVSYVWDDLTRPHKLMVKINGSHMQREINLDKLRPWKSFSRVRRQGDLASQLSLETRASDRRGTNPVQMNGSDMGNVGYEVYVDGPTRVLRISQAPGRSNFDSKYQFCKKVQLRISYFAIRLLEPCKQDQPEDVNPYDLSTYMPIIIGRLENISFDSIIISQRMYNQIRVQSVNVDEKWVGAPFAAMLRRHLTSNTSTDESVLFVVFILFPSVSNIRDVRYSSVILQPIDLNLDEETLMKIVPFWRTSLSSSTQSQQYYFDHFEIHPIKITASFLPEDSYSNYSSGQEALRSLLHSVIKIPAIKNLDVELNGVLVTHALVTTRELLLRCAQHYSWYGMRAIYIAKGSHLLPPSFASVFDDLASSSLDVFFDPSSSLFNVQGLTLGTFKLISKCIEDKGFSGTKRYFGDLSKTLKNAGSNILFAAVTEVSDSVLKGAESSGFNGMVTGFHHGILRLAMEPSLLGTAFLEGGPDRKIKLDRSPGIDELYVEGYLQAMLDTIYKQEYLRVRVIDDQVILKNLPPNSSLINEIMERVKDFLVSKALLKGDFSTGSRPLRHLRRENEWRIGPTVLTLCQHLFVSFAIRSLRKQTDNAVAKLKLKEKWAHKNEGSETSSSDGETTKGKSIWRWGFGKFVLSAMVAYIDGRLCRCIPNPIARRITSGFLLSFLDSNDSK